MRHPIDYYREYEAANGPLPADTPDGGLALLLAWIAEMYGQAESDRVDRYIASTAL